MAWLEKRPGGFQLSFRFGGKKFTRSLKTKTLAAARGALVRLEDNLRRVELGLLEVPDRADPAIFLLSDGKLDKRPGLPPIRLLSELTKAYLDSIPEGALESSTLGLLRLHFRHLERHLGANAPLATLSVQRVQDYVARRLKESGLRGKTVSPATIKKELDSLGTAWKWASNGGLAQFPPPSRATRFPKTKEKSPFLTLTEVEHRVARGGLPDEDVQYLWKSVFLSQNEIQLLLSHVKQSAIEPVAYPMFVFAAHTGARRSEMLRAQLDDVDFASTILIRKKKRVRGKCVLVHRESEFSDWN